jgi:hypothetical protein
MHDDYEYYTVIQYYILSRDIQVALRPGYPHNLKKDWTFF